ncbi:ABC transporter permease, partial [Streptomyces albipurpureus]
MLRATLRSFFAHKGRLLLSMLAVLLSVAFVSGSLIFSDTVSRTFDRLFASTAADVTITPKEGISERIPSGAVRTLPAALADRVAAIDGVDSAHIEAAVENITVIDDDREPVAPSTGAVTIATNWYITERSPVKLTTGREPRGAGEALIDRDTADRRKLKIGDGLTLQAQPGSFKVEIVGIATFTTTNPGAALVFLDTATAQSRLLGGADRATSITLDAADGIEDTVLKQRVAAELGDGFELKTADEQAETAAAELGGFLDVITYVLLGFAGVAVLVGVFLIVNTFSMLIAQRTRELGLLRALGADRGQVRRSVLAEAFLLGLIGSTLGLASGVGLAAGLIALMDAFGMNLGAAQMVVSTRTPIAAYAVGLGVTFLAAYLPARRAARVSPMAALTDAEIAGTGRPLKVRAIVGAVVAALGVAALTGSALSDETASAASLLTLGIPLTLIAMVIAGPLLVRPVIRVLGGAFPRVFGPVGRMSQRNALRNPRRTGATAAALMVGLSMVGGLSIASASMTKSFDQQIDRTLGADFVVQNSNFFPFPQEVTETVQNVESAGTVVRLRFTPIGVTLPDGKRVETTAAGYDPQLDQAARITYAAGDTSAALASDAVAMAGDFAKDHRVRIGSVVTAEFPGGRTTRLTVGALTDMDQAGGPGTEGGLFMGLATVEKYLPGGQEAALYVNAASGSDPADLRKDLERALDPYPQVQVRDQADYKELVGQQIAVMLYLVYALLGLAIVIAVLG